MGLVTLNQVKYYLGIQVSNVEHDEFLEGSEDGTVKGLIDLVSDEFTEAIDNDVESTEHEVTINGSGCAVQPLPYWPIISLYGGDEAARLANLQERGSATEAWEDIVTDEDYVFLDTDRPWAIVLLDGYTFPSGTKNIRVKYNAGYSEIPSEITLAVLERVAIKFMESKRSGAGRLGVDTNSAGGMGSQSQSFNDLQTRWDAAVRKYGRVM